MTIRDEIDALPGKPKDYAGDPLDWESYYRARLALAERLLRAAIGHPDRHETCDARRDAAIYLAKREAE